MSTYCRYGRLRVMCLEWPADRRRPVRVTIVMRGASKQHMQHSAIGELRSILSATSGMNVVSNRVMQPPTARSVCPACASARTHIVGQSGEPSFIHRRCDDCQLVFSGPLHDVYMNQTEMRRLGMKARFFDENRFIEA
jgi:hypothetical protein